MRRYLYAQRDMDVANRKPDLTEGLWQRWGGWGKELRIWVDLPVGELQMFVDKCWWPPPILPFLYHTNLAFYNPLEFRCSPWGRGNQKLRLPWLDWNLIFTIQQHRSFKTEIKFSCTEINSQLLAHLSLCFALVPAALVHLQWSLSNLAFFTGEATMAVGNTWPGHVDSSYSVSASLFPLFSNLNLSFTQPSHLIA